MSICGLDFGTSNTTLGTVISDVPVLAALEGDHVTIPSAIFYKADTGVHIGRRAIQNARSVSNRDLSRGGVRHVDVIDSHAARQFPNRLIPFRSGFVIHHGIGAHSFQAI